MVDGSSKAKAHKNIQAQIPNHRKPDFDYENEDGVQITIPCGIIPFRGMTTMPSRM
jgi:hypothetical protein